VLPPIHSLPTCRQVSLTFLAVHLLLIVQCGWAQENNAATIYAEKCAQCHGSKGQGTTDGYKKPLRGEQTIAELAELIEETMPEKAPEACVGEEARQVAEYIHRQFYSREPGFGAPRVSLARLTVDQYRNAVADAVGRFAPTKAPPTRSRRRGRRAPEQSSPGPTVPGLRGEYFQSRGMSKADQLAHYSSDTHIEFDFGEGSPAATISKDQFSIVWQGGLVANDTGHYEFRVNTQNGARLYLNLDPHQGLRKLRDDSSAAGTHRCLGRFRRDA
jgi:cytochrome c553